MMKPIKFKESNKELQKPASMTDEECGPLPIMNDGEQCVSCWKLSWREWFSVLFFGKIWLSVHSGETQPPVWLWGIKTPFIHEKKRKYWYTPFIIRKLKAPKLFIGLWPISISFWPNSIKPTVVWHGFKNLYRI